MLREVTGRGRPAGRGRRAAPAGRAGGRLLLTRRSTLLAGLGAGLVAVAPRSALSEPRAGAGAAHAQTSDVGTRATFRDLVPCGARTLHVAGTGSDGASGTEGDPLREIRTAVRRARPGDLVLVGPGTYGYTEVRGFAGRPDAWLGIMAAPGATPVISVPPPTDSFVNVVGSSYVGLYGLEVRGSQENPNTNGSGISVYGDSHHVRLWGNHVHDFPGGGINCFDVDGSHDCVDVSHNVVHGTSRYSPQNTSGISIYASRDLTGGATLEDGYGYRVVGNYVYDVECTVPFTPGGFDVVTDGNAVSLDLIAETHGYRKPILVADNVLVGCGGRAVHAYGTVNVDVVGNTAVGNLRTASPALTGGVEMDGTTDGSVRFTGNVICPLNTPRSTDSTSTYTGNVVLGGTQDVPAGNEDQRAAGLAWFRGPGGAGSAGGGLTAAALRSAQPLSAFAPRDPRDPRTCPASARDVPATSA